MAVHFALSRYIPAAKEENSQLMHTVTELSRKVNVKLNGEYKELAHAEESLSS